MNDLSDEQHIVEFVQQYIQTNTQANIQANNLQKIQSIKPLGGGANNKVLKVECGQQSYVVKQFFDMAGQGQAKFYAEVAFYQLAEQSLERDGYCSNLLACSKEHGLLLLSYIAKASEITPSLYLSKVEGRNFVESSVAQSIDFIEQLNAEPQLAESLPLASDAAQSTQTVLEQLNKRAKRLTVSLLAQDSELARECKSFVESELINALEQIKQQAAEFNDVSYRLDIASPSDFGLHNALWEESLQRLYFLDFEYAGCDSSTKLVCDFFCQPKFPINPEYIQQFAQHSLFKSAFKNLDAFLWCYKATQLKWCFILLNEFVTQVAQRRIFSAQENLNLVAKQQKQLDKCQAYFCETKERFNLIRSALLAVNAATNKATSKATNSMRNG